MLRGRGRHHPGLDRQARCRRRHGLAVHNRLRRRRHRTPQTRFRGQRRRRPHRGDRPHWSSPSVSTPALRVEGHVGARRRAASSRCCGAGSATASRVRAAGRSSPRTTPATPTVPRGLDEPGRPAHFPWCRPTPSTPRLVAAARLWPDPLDQKVGDRTAPDRLSRVLRRDGVGIFPEGGRGRETCRGRLGLRGSRSTAAPRSSHCLLGYLSDWWSMFDPLAARAAGWSSTPGPRWSPSFPTASRAG